MAATKTSTWKTILSVAGVVLAVAMVVSGQLLLAGVLLVLLLIFGGGALLYSKAGPPDR